MTKPSKAAPVRETKSDNSPSPGLRRYLYLTTIITGAAILVVEILGAKMLSPYVGTSHFVWTAQITITLVSLATGYYFGGWLVDRSTNLSRLYACLLVAGIFLGGSVWACEAVAFWALQFKLAAGALLASAFLFFIPLTLLATTGPFLIRVFTTGIQAVGGNAGRLSALSTLGSVAGTILIGYVLIPFLPNSYTMYLTSAVLLALASGYFFIWGKNSGIKGAALAGTLAGLAAGFTGVQANANPHFTNSELLSSSNSNFGELMVVDHKKSSRRLYLNDGLIQNTYDPVEKKSTSLFTCMLHGLAHAYTERIDRVLCIGMGVGIVPMQFANEGVKVDVVEINPAVVPVAEKYFNFVPERLTLTIDDGRHFLNETTNSYDAIVLDAFLGDSCPSHLMTREAFAAMHRHLRPGGVLVINSFGDQSQGESFFTASLFKTLQTVFKSVKIHASGNGNVFFVAGTVPELKLLHEYSLEQVHHYVQPQVQAAFSGLRTTDPAHGIVLTDDFNPVDYYDAANREKVRRQLADFMREL